MGEMEGGSSKPLSKEFLLLLLLFPFLLPIACCCPSSSSSSSNAAVLPPSNNRGTLEIGIGIGIGGPQVPPPQPGCPPPPPSQPPPRSPPPPPSPRPRPPSPRPPQLLPRSQFLNGPQYRAYLVIQRFKETITCDPMGVTKTWVGNRPCKYRGYFCDTPPTRNNSPSIASVDFNGFGLGAPTICNFVDQLPDLALFHANSNNLTGTIPDLTSLQFLYELDVSNNKMTGSFPVNVLPLKNLLFLDIRFNQFAGTVPGTVFFLSGLDVLFLNNNNFNNPLPSALGSTRAAYLTLANNGFTGPIPRSIGNTAETLIEVLFLNNQLSGCLPYEVGLLKKATVFDVGFNRITGPIPLSFGCLFKVEQLNLAGNLIYGEVPNVVCQLATGYGHLQNLSLSGNYLTSVGESCWRLIRNGVLNVRRNCIKGLKDQRSPEECWRFFEHPMSCPFHTYIPCHLSYEEGGHALPSTPEMPAVHKRHAS